jgi:hypothetical protein
MEIEVSVQSDNLSFGNVQVEELFPVHVFLPPDTPRERLFSFRNTGHFSELTGIFFPEICINKTKICPKTVCFRIGIKKKSIFTGLEDDFTGQ